MRRIYTARNLIEAQAIKDFLDDKGINSEYSPAASSLQFGVYDIPIYIGESDHSEKLLEEINSFVKSPKAEESNAAPAKKEVWSPKVATAIFLLLALPGGYAIAVGLRLSGYFFRPAMAIGELSILCYFILLKRWRIRDYFNLISISSSAYLLWITLDIVRYFAVDRIFYFEHLPRTLYFKQALEAAPLPTILGTILVAPVVEECIFRGFLFKSFESANMFVGVIITAFLWTLPHFQSGLNIYEIGAIFLGGILLGAARAKTGSLYAPLLMHVTFNTTVVIDYYRHF